MEKNLYKFLFRITCLGVLILLFKIISPYTFDDWFPIDEITISGDYKYLERDQVILVAENYLEGNFFTLNINLLKKGMKKLPWVKDVDIYRKWPNRITMIISQHKPIARYGMQGLINEEGEFFGAAYEDYLPIFYGPREEIPILTIKYYSFNEILKEELIKIHKITFTKKKDWEIISTDGMKIKLNNIRPEYDLKRFIKNYQNVLKSLNKRVTYVDLRYRDGFSIGTKN